MEQKTKSFTTHDRDDITIKEIRPKEYLLAILIRNYQGFSLRLTRSDLENLAAVLKEELDNTQ